MARRCWSTGSGCTSCVVSSARPQDVAAQNLTAENLTPVTLELVNNRVMVHPIETRGAIGAYDGATGRVTNIESANALLGRTYRKGWELPV